ncbi:MAG: ABC transporter permease [Thermoanaerobacteraceae bacterium]|uniref:ABC transporter permease n=1 Tax=Thermanaeromonas sp. C210 TaxID=2731925 RepID=UPI00155BC6A0|nr:ABC transporter permease [Thermanaeromonas sp. C210]MBE3580563.1 ABC transporter permease [Thermoanaerobacteraceae bacterium]GFN22303.1 ABC transporter permease [Thermanaeromonas sp. C210]
MEGSLGIALVSWAVMSIRMMTPLLYTALGGVFAEKVGIFNFGLEGMMLAGAFFGYLGTLVGGSVWVGVIFALCIGALTGLVMGYFAVGLRASQMVFGIGVNIFYLGLTNYLYRILSAGEGSLEVALFPTIKIPLLADIPVLGPILFEHNLLVYLALLLVVLSWWFFYHTATGLSFRSAGENPAAADTAGINVVRVRYAAAVVSGMLAAMGGGFLTLTQVSRFLEDISHGRGWIALAAVIFGKWNPWGVMGACFLFGAATALQMQMQVLGVKVPYQVVEMIPYLLTMLALAGMIGRVRRPASLGKAYVKE